MPKPFQISLVLTGLCFLWPLTCPACFEPLAAGARSAGMGETISIRFPDPFGQLSNPASLGCLTTGSMGTHYTRLFGMKELSHARIIIGFPTSLGGFGCGGRTFGNEFYHESDLQFGWGVCICPALYAGFMTHFCQVEIRGFQSTHAFLFDMGLIYRYREFVSMGWSVQNINRFKIGKSKEPVPQVTHLHFEIIPLSGIQCNLEFFKDVRFPLEIHAGLEIIPVDGMALRCGFIHSPPGLMFGTGIHLGRWMLDYAWVNHSVLNVTHHASLLFYFKPVTIIPIHFD